jgi:hypothetical protein
VGCSPLSAPRSSLPAASSGPALTLLLAGPRGSPPHGWSSLSSPRCQLPAASSGPALTLLLAGQSLRGSPPHGWSLLSSPRSQLPAASSGPALTLLLAGQRGSFPHSIPWLLQVSSRLSSLSATVSSGFKLPPPSQVDYRLSTARSTGTFYTVYLQPLVACQCLSLAYSDSEANRVSDYRLRLCSHWQSWCSIHSPLFALRIQLPQVASRAWPGAGNACFDAATAVARAVALGVRISLSENGTTALE